MEVRSASCERAAQFVSLDLDCELSRFERALLARHLRRCPRCAEDARQIVALTEAVRSAPLERIPVPVVVVRRHRHVAHIARNAIAVAAVAVAGIWLGLAAVGESRSPTIPAQFTPKVETGAVADGRFDWPAGPPRGPQLIQFIPGGLYTSTLES